MFKTKYFQIYNVFSKKEVFTKILHFQIFHFYVGGGDGEHLPPSGNKFGQIS